MIDFSNVYGADSETKLIEPGLLAPPLVVVSKCGPDLVSTLHHVNDDAHEVLKDLYQNRNSVWHNGAFDHAVFAARFPDLLSLIFRAFMEDRIVDTLVCERLIHIARGTLDEWYDHNGQKHKERYGLTNLSETYGFGPMEKDEWRLRYGEFIDLPRADLLPEGAQNYAKLDALRTLQVFYKQAEFEPFLVDACAQSRASLALHLMSVRGIITDARQCQAFYDATKADIERARKDLVLAGFVRADGSKDTKKAKAYMVQVCTEMGIPVPQTKRTKNSSAGWKPGVSLDAEATAYTGDLLLMDYSLYTSANTALTRVEELKTGSQGTPIQTSFSSPMSTGRLSSHGDEEEVLNGKNLTNLPRKPGLRECFIPRPGFVFCSLDLDAAEGVAVAQIHKWVFGRSTLGDAINNDKDIHCMLAAQMLSCSYEEAFKNKKIGKYATERQNAKYGNYGFWGGMGIPKFVATTNKGIKLRQNKITIATGERIERGWKKTWAPESEDYFIWINKILDNGGVFNQFISGRVRGNCSYTELANTGFQGLIADLIKEAFFKISYEMYCEPSSPLYGSRILVIPHDEIFAELVEEKAHDAAHRMQNILLTVANTKYTPDVKMTASPALCRRWWKGAPTLYVHGQLVPAKPQVDGRDIIVVPENTKVEWVPDLEQQEVAA